MRVVTKNGHPIKGGRSGKADTSGLFGLGLWFDLHFCLLALVVGLAPTPFLNLVALFAHNSLYFAISVRLVSCRNMKIHCGTFNTYLLCFCFCLLGLASSAEESSPSTVKTNATQKADAAKAEQKKKKRKKEVVTVRVHLEVNKDNSGRNREVSVLRSNPMRVNVDKVPVADETNLAEAKMIETPGGVELELQFDSQGRTAIENYTAANRGRHFAIFCDFGEQHRWLGAPVITRLISNGIIRFTPDASQDEVDRIVEGLNRLAQVKKKKKDDF